MTREELIEALAANRVEARKRNKNYATYAELPAEAQEYVRAEVMRDWPLIVGFVASWLDGYAVNALSTTEGRELVDAWREEMEGMP